MPHSFGVPRIERAWLGKNCSFNFIKPNFDCHNSFYSKKQSTYTYTVANYVILHCKIKRAHWIATLFQFSILRGDMCPMAAFKWLLCNPLRIDWRECNKGHPASAPERPCGSKNSAIFMWHKEKGGEDDTKTDMGKKIGFDLIILLHPLSDNQNCKVIQW